MGHGATGCECSRHGEQHNLLAREDSVRADVFRAVFAHDLEVCFRQSVTFCDCHVVTPWMMWKIRLPTPHNGTQGSRKQASMVAISSEFNTLTRTQREARS